jgi:hypothetical protein
VFTNFFLQDHIQYHISLIHNSRLKITIQTKPTICPILVSIHMVTKFQVQQSSQYWYFIILKSSYLFHVLVTKYRPEFKLLRHFVSRCHFNTHNCTGPTLDGDSIRARYGCFFQFAVFFWIIIALKSKCSGKYVNKFSLYHFIHNGTRMAVFKMRCISRHIDLSLNNITQRDGPHAYHPVGEVLRSYSLFYERKGIDDL